MKRGQAFLAQAVLLAPVVASIFNLWAAENPMTAEQRARVVHMLKESANEYLSSIENVHPTQWNWKPAPDRWSVGQTAEHIVQAEAVIFARLQLAIQSPANGDPETATLGKTQMLERVMLDRSQKAMAPPSIQPLGIPKEEAMRRFNELRAKLIRFAEETGLPLEKHTADHPFPAFNTLNAYQWLVLVHLHQARHQQQIEEVKATPGYPR